MNKLFTAAQLCWMGGGFIITFFAVGMPYWSIPYDQDPNTLVFGFFLLGLSVVVLTAAIIRIFGGIGFLMATFVIGASLPAVILARVIVDTAKDPTSHNLWPFEVVGAVTGGLFWAGLGALIGSLYARWTKKK
jgi:hypothetical protein